MSTAARTSGIASRAAPRFSFDVLSLDGPGEVERIVTHLRSYARGRHRRGAVVGVSGGIDSSVSFALAVRAFGAERVVPLLLQEKESSPDNPRYVRALCRTYGMTPLVEDITAALEGVGCYRRRDQAIREVFPEYDPTFKSRITLPGNLLDSDALGLFSVTIVSPEGVEMTRRLPLDQYLQIVAATNFKQRIRMTMLFHYADSLGYAVVGTANRNERDQGFFVKYGDGGVDVDAIAHLYKTQVYQLASHLDIPTEIQGRAPTTDTYSAPTTEEEFFFQLPFAVMDLLLYAEQHAVPPETAAAVMGLRRDQIERAYRQFRQRRRSTEYLRTAISALEPPVSSLLDPVTASTGMA